MAIRSGKEYIESLQKNPREVYVNGEKVTDVVDYPAFRRPIEAIARLYDLKHDPRYQADLTYVEPSTGELTDITYLMSRTKEDMAKKGKAYEIYAKGTYGMMGRGPEFMNAYLTGYACGAGYYKKYGPEYEENILRYYRYVRDNDLFLTHALGTPQTDRSKQSSQQRDQFLHLGVKEETSEGVIVRGAKQLATMGGLTDEIMVFPNGRQFGPGDERYCLGFAIPSSTPGVKFLCREPLVPDDSRNLYDHPLSARYEEIDCMVYFDDVLVPWDRLFFYNNLEIANTARDNTAASPDAYHQAAVRAMVKARLAAAIIYKITDSVKTNVYPQVAEKVGHVIAMAKATEAMVIAAEETGGLKNGIWMPNKDYLVSVMILYAKFYDQMLELIKSVSTAGLMLTPTLADFKGPEGELFNHYFAGAEMDGLSRVQIAKLAWDFAGDSFGQRLALYERAYTGDPMFLAANFSKRADITDWLVMCDQLLEEGKKEVEMFSQA